MFQVASVHLQYSDPASMTLGSLTQNLKLAQGIEVFQPRVGDICADEFKTFQLVKSLDYSKGCVTDFWFSFTSGKIDPGHVPQQVVSEQPAESQLVRRAILIIVLNRSTELPNYRHGGSCCSRAAFNSVASQLHGMATTTTSNKSERSEN